MVEVLFGPSTVMEHMKIQNRRRVPMSRTVVAAYHRAGKNRHRHRRRQSLLTVVVAFSEMGFAEEPKQLKELELH